MITHTTPDDPELRAAYGLALRDGFNSLGSIISRVVENYISRKYNVELIDTYRNPRLLAEALDKVMGAGSIIVLDRIIKSVYSQLSIPLPVNEPEIRLGHPEDFENYLSKTP